MFKDKDKEKDKFDRDKAANYSKDQQPETEMPGSNRTGESFEQKVNKAPDYEDEEYEK